MSADLKIQIMDYEIVNNILLIKWDGGKESFIPLKKLRDEGPCANCSGETDVFGTVYKGIPQLKTDKSYTLNQIEDVGRYGLKPSWKDRHDAGIFTFKLLKELGE